MKIYIKPTIFVTLLICFSPLIKSQDINKVIMSAMQKEIKRSMDSLQIDKMAKPSFLSYGILDADFVTVNAILGGITESKVINERFYMNRLLVSSDNKTNENYLDENMIWSWDDTDYSVVKGSDENAIRRCLWLSTDKKYKSAITTLEAKISAINQQNLSAEEKQLPDFCKVSPVIKKFPSPVNNINKVALETMVKEASLVFKKYPKIQVSEASLSAISGTMYFANSEGTSVRFPVEVVAFRITARTQAQGGEPLVDHVLLYFPKISDLPSSANINAEVEKMAKTLSQLVDAPIINEPYSGPVLFEDEAAAEAIVQKFFSDKTGLFTVRKPIIASPEIASMAADKLKENSLEAMMNKKVISRDFSITAIPFQKEYDKIKLIGSFEIDAEGVVPSQSISIIENGVLKTLFSDRNPSLKVQTTNGHSRPYFNYNGIGSSTGVGVAQFINNNPLTSFTKDELKAKLIAAAKEEDLEYAYIVRKVVSEAANLNEEGGVTFFGSEKKKPELTKVIQIYRVKVSDGSEVLIRNAEVQGLNIKAFKHVIGTSKYLQAYNTLLTPVKQSVWNTNQMITGYAASFIVPQGILFSELEVVLEKQNMIKRNPIVTNPVAVSK
ncbi:MAG: metallopeptidase TldD-related protein [Bacteroidota bacterium]